MNVFTKQRQTLNIENKLTVIKVERRRGEKSLNLEEAGTKYTHTRKIYKPQGLTA